MKYDLKKQTEPVKSSGDSREQPLFGPKVFTLLVAIAVIALGFSAVEYLEADQRSSGMMSFSHFISLLFYLPLILLIAVIAYVRGRQQNSPRQIAGSTTKDKIISAVKLAVLLLLATVLLLVIIGSVT